MSDPDATLSADDLLALVRRVFAPTPADRRLAILVDLPDAAVPDRPPWAARRRLAAAWSEVLRERSAELGLEVDLVLYRNARRNNAELPATMVVHREGRLPEDAGGLEAEHAVPTEQILGEHSIVIALVELSATAPLKVAAPRLGFRAASMPGFSPAMIPALRLDVEEVDRRVRRLAAWLDEAVGADLRFVVGGAEHHLHLDLRYRSGHASGGLVRRPGEVGNVPSGEAYAVPYEGERPGEPSRSEGELPVQLDDEVVLYRIERNKAVAVRGDGPRARAEAEAIAGEPAYANLAELGLGILGDFGVKPIGETLLDEKLGLHVAFGRSDHFGGQVGPSDFSRPEAVIHVDRVYLPETQPRIGVRRVTLTFPDGEERELMRDGRWSVAFG